MPTGKPGVAGGAALVAMLGVADPDTVFLILTPRLERDAQSSNWVKAVETQGRGYRSGPLMSTGWWPGCEDAPAGWVSTSRATGLKCLQSVPKETCSRPTRSWRN